jgi:antitoxin component YwqK of YwqJK toxin-antitoxin module
MLSLVSYGKERVSTEKIVNTYSQSKILLKSETYKDGYLNGPYVEYYPNGKIKVQGE